MVYLIILLRFSDKTLRLLYLRLGNSPGLLSSQIHTLAAAKAVAIANTETRVNILSKAGTLYIAWKPLRL